MLRPTPAGGRWWSAGWRCWGRHPRVALSRNRFVFEVESFRYRFVTDLAVRDVETVREMRILPHRLFGTQVRDLQRKGQGGVVERERAGPSYRARHVGHAI